ncbi:MAG: hypothetical protein R1F52_07585 [Candidatus Nitrosoabyssus spongiisocia]|nr:MAG: hypothetical protein R1F52_07585 [Nitrosopumilaceae archaeon AB1(1)]
MAVERYIALAGMALFAMFVGEIASLFHFMIESETDNVLQLLIGFDTSAKILQFISIGSAPGLILTGVSFIMSKRYGSKSIGSIIIVGGSILFLGMYYCFTLLDKIDPQYLDGFTLILPILFMIIAIPVIITGVSLLKIKHRLPKKDLL